MRKFIDIISETARPTRMKTATDLSSLMPPIGGNVMPAATSPSELSLTKAGRAGTDTAMANARMPNMARAAHSNLLRDLEGLNIEDEMTDAEARRQSGRETDGYSPPVVPENLPAVIQRAMVPEAGDFDPKWNQVKHLPGYLQSGIRQIGRQVFRQFTNTPIEDIQMMCDILNPPSDVRKMAGWIVRNGVRQTEANIDFADTLPGYAETAGLAECKLYNACGYQFLIMRDNGGHYIYGWPADEGQVTDMNAGHLLISESNHCSTKFDDIEDDVCPECGMHKEWHRGLGPETMKRSNQYTKDVEARGKMFADRAARVKNKPAA